MTRANTFLLCTLLSIVWAVLTQSGLAQTPDKSRSAENLPSAPQPQNPLPPVY